MLASEMDIVNFIAQDTNILSNELQQGLHFVGKHNHPSDILAISAIQYSNRVTIHVNEEEPKSDGVKLESRKGMIKVPGLIHKRSN